jgi:hypothetical protein
VGRDRNDQGAAVTNGDAKIAVSMLFGRIEIRTWFAPRGDRMVGMGRKRVFDGSGRLVEDTTIETGCVLEWAQP